LHVVDASDEARDDHLRTVLTVLEQLELLNIPRLLVFNKIDLIEPADRSFFERSYDDAVFVSAKARETMRPLIERIAALLADKWVASAKGPNREPGDVSAAVSDSAIDEAAELTTLDQMLRAGGKRARTKHVA
jgi:GTP-binding protein HflX